jgi:MYXO-CTERM domain-containing protein
MKTIAKLCLVLVAIYAGVPGAEAAFVGPYAPGNFNLINSNADGLAALQLDGSLLVIGGNNGSGSLGTTDYLVAAFEVGIVSFNFYYSAQDTPTYDFAGYMLGNSYFQFADTVGNSGTITFAVTAGQIFGFRVGTQDNTGEPGQLTISDFSAPDSGGGSATPEPSTWLTMAAGVAALVAWSRRQTGAKHSITQKKWTA